MTDITNLTLDELRLELAPEIAAAAGFDGWSAEAVESAAAALGCNLRVALAAFPGGAMEMIAAWIARIDAAMVDALPAGALAALPVRERIRRLVRFRLDALSGHEEALRRALVIMAMPQNLGEGFRLGWNSADIMWRLAGDMASDWNHYSKRAILAGIHAATLTVYADDKSEGKVDTIAFLDRRIDGVMRFEKAKARLLRPREDGFSLVRLLGRLRYPAV